MNIFEQMTAELEAQKDRSAWGRGVNAYALELVEELEERAQYEGRDPQPGKECREWMLNGAVDWSQYSWGGSSLIYDGDIAERLCTPSELKKTRNGDRRPNSREEWLDVQARALYQACNRVTRLYRECVRGGVDMKKLQPCEVYAAAVAVLPASDIDHHATDLYIRVTAKSKALANRFEYAHLVQKFRSQIDNNLWYDLPFCYMPGWDGKEV